MPNHKINLLGKQFGKWTVIAEAPSLKTSYKTLAMWTCQCQCGVIKDVRADDLRNGRSTQCKSCAAKLQKKKTQNLIPIIDETDKVYGEITVLKRIDNDKNNAACWQCQCSCGNIFIARGCDLRQNKYLSCGCKGSKGEGLIYSILQNNQINFKKQFSFDDLRSEKNYPLRFDFALFDDNNNLIKLIEFQGIQHYKNIDFFTMNPQKNDELKRQYCKDHNIKLLEIPYWDFDKIDIDYLLNK